MLLAYAIPPDQPMFANHALMAMVAETSSPISSLTSGVPIDSVSIGKTKYQFRVPSLGYFLPMGSPNSPAFFVNAFGSDFVGHGASPSDAKRSWEEEFHREFQRLFAMRDWEMDASDRRRWERIQNWIDVELYRSTTPLVGREIGQILSTDPGRRKIQWVDGRREAFDLEIVPGHFVAIRPGMWFEAQVERDAVSGQLRQILSSQRIESLDHYTPNALKEQHEAYGKTDQLPDAML